jgi:thiamine transport system substrate-binding protein
MKRALVFAVLLSVAVAACGGDNSKSTSATTGASGTTGATGPAGSVTITLITHNAFAYTKSVLDQFTAQTGITVNVPQGVGDAGVVLNKAILTKGKPEGDVLWGVDNTLLSRAVDSGAFQPYTSPALTTVAPPFRDLAPGHELTPVDYGDVCINYDKAWFQSKGIAPPQSLDDLRQPQYKNLLVAENPSTSSPGLVFLLATVAKYGVNGWQAYWKDLRANGVKVVDDWTTAYTQLFSGSSGKGAYPLVVSYGSSPPAEVVGVEPQPTEAPTGVLTDSCFRQEEFVGILAGTKHAKEAGELIDFLLSRTFQEDMPLNMYVYPVQPDAALPDVFTKFAVVPSTSLSLPPKDIADNRDKWIDEWTNVVLR